LTDQSVSQERKLEVSVMQDLLKPWSRLESWLQLIAGAYLFLVPAFFSDTRTDGGASWNSYVFGAVIAVLALWALATPRSELLEWVSAVAGLWVLVAPFALGFTDLTAAAVSSYVVGALTIIVAVVAQQRTHRAITGGGPRVSPS
jgi:SPW repeat-containing protein